MTVRKNIWSHASFQLFTHSLCPLWQVRLRTFTDMFIWSYKCNLLIYMHIPPHSCTFDTLHVHVHHLIEMNFLSALMCLYAYTAVCPKVRICIFVHTPTYACGDQHSQIEKLSNSKSVLFLISFPRGKWTHSKWKVILGPEVLRFSVQCGFNTLYCRL